MTETAKMRPEPIKVETLRHRRSAGRDKLKENNEMIHCKFTIFHYYFLAPSISLY